MQDTEFLRLRQLCQKGRLRINLLFYESLPIFWKLVGVIGTLIGLFVLFSPQPVKYLESFGLLGFLIILLILFVLSTLIAVLQKLIIYYKLYLKINNLMKSDVNSFDSLFIVAAQKELLEKIRINFENTEKLCKDSKNILLQAEKHIISLKLLTHKRDIIEEMKKIVNEAESIFVATGSRSRDKVYLEAIEEKLRQASDLVHYRILWEHPYHAILKNHLVNIRILRDIEKDKERFGSPTICIGRMKNNHEPEKFICSNQKRSLIVLPSFNNIGGFDTALIIEDREYAGKMVSHVQQLYAMSEHLETINEIEKLEVVCEKHPYLPSCQ